MLHAAYINVYTCLCSVAVDVCLCVRCSNAFGGVVYLQERLDLMAFLGFLDKKETLEIQVNLEFQVSCV